MLQDHDAQRLEEYQVESEILVSEKLSVTEFQGQNELKLQIVILWIVCSW